ncbi:MAG TPA: homocysteine S-methyltransferase family protein [Candidatus Acidoferrales bacterium]|nr:homocysteine S-methyltransferase family protein [Candidatus Acidoferrales bacterium]
MTGKELLNILKDKVLVFDGATGTSLQNQNLTSADFGGEKYSGCNEYLNIVKPEATEKVHLGFLEAGADIIETNSFGGTSIVLAEYGLAEESYEINKRSAETARKAADKYSGKGQKRYVAGSMGPTTKLPSLGHIEFDAMRDSYKVQVKGLADGGADLLIVETCQDLLQTKAALAAIQEYLEETERDIAVVASITIETMGTMLMGTEISAALTTIEPYDIVTVFGMNCATGPKEMEENVRYLCENSPKPVFVMPNAGLPENIGGQACYHLTPDELEFWMKRFVNEFGVSMIGGCCGTTPEHIARLVKIASESRPKKREYNYAPSVSSIYSSVALHLDPPPVIVGERCNANGSRKFKELLLAEDYDAMVQLAKEQMKEGAHILDLCVAYVGRDEVRDIKEVVKRFNTQVALPLMIDSTEYRVIEEALKRYAGKAVVNSINLEDGEERMRHVLPLCKRYGAAVVALTIDESGMAKTREKKFQVAKRIRDLAINKYGMREEDLIFDTLTFTLGSGDEEFRKAGIETIEAIRMIKKEFPKAYTLLGVSNASFGLNAHARHVLNSVFLHYAIEAGLDLSIVNAQKIMPLYKIDERGREISRQLIFDERKFETVET